MSRKGTQKVELSSLLSALRAAPATHSLHLPVITLKGSCCSPVKVNEWVSREGKPQEDRICGHSRCYFLLCFPDEGGIKEHAKKCPDLNCTRVWTELQPIKYEKKRDVMPILGLLYHLSNYERVNSSLSWCIWKLPAAYMFQVTRCLY